jgi:hypothetical protein
VSVVVYAGVLAFGDRGRILPGVKTGSWTSVSFAVTAGQLELANLVGSTLDGHWLDLHWLDLHWMDLALSTRQIYIQVYERHGGCASTYYSGIVTAA